MHTVRCGGVRRVLARGGIGVGGVVGRYMFPTYAGLVLGTHVRGSGRPATSEGSPRLFPGRVWQNWDFGDLQDLQDFGVLQVRRFRVVFALLLAMCAVRRGGVLRVLSKGVGSKAQLYLLALLHMRA